MKSVLKALYNVLKAILTVFIFVVLTPLLFVFSVMTSGIYFADNGIATPKRFVFAMAVFTLGFIIWTLFRHRNRKIVGLMTLFIVAPAICAFTFWGVGAVMEIDSMDTFPLPGSTSFECTVTIEDPADTLLNLRSKPADIYSILVQVPEGSELTITRLSLGNWGQTSYGGFQGWVNMDFCYSMN
jgi:hypothetical protein